VPDASAADLARLQAAASQLIGSGQAALVRRAPRHRPAGGAAGGTATGQVVAFGKRVSDRPYVDYEQGLTVTAKLVRLSYVLTRTLTVNAQTNATTSSFGFTYRRWFD
jgi:translocation and assembly module TamB